jgi:hypothetical protein
VHGLPKRLVLSRHFVNGFDEPPHPYFAVLNPHAEQELGDECVRVREEAGGRRLEWQEREGKISTGILRVRKKCRNENHWRSIYSDINVPNPRHRNPLSRPSQNRLHLQGGFCFSSPTCLSSCSFSCLLAALCSTTTTPLLVGQD